MQNEIIRSEYLIFNNTSVDNIKKALLSTGQLRLNIFNKHSHMQHGSLNSFIQFY